MLHRHTSGSRKLFQQSGKHHRSVLPWVWATHAKFEQARLSLREQNPQMSESELRDRALYRAATLDRCPKKQSAMRVLVILWVIATLLLIAKVAHGQSSVTLQGIGKGSTASNSATVTSIDGNHNGLDVNVAAGKVAITDSAGASITLGQKAMAASFPVVLASDQSNLPTDPQGPDAQGASQTGKPLQNGGRYYTDGTVRTFAAGANGEQIMQLPAQPFLNAVQCSDCVAGTPVTGDLITPGAGTKWARLAGSANNSPYHLSSTASSGVPTSPIWLADPCFNPKAFGAKGDGSDDTAAINSMFTVIAATSYAAKVCFPPGIYRTGAITYNHGGIIIEGSGFFDNTDVRPGTLWIYNGAVGSDLLSMTGTAGARLDRVRISDLKMDGNQTARYTLRWEKMDEPTLSNVRLAGGAESDFLGVDATGIKWFNVSLTNSPNNLGWLSWGTGGFAWLGGELAPQQGMTDASFVMEGAANGDTIQDVEEDNGNTPFVGFIAIRGYDTNSAKLSVPTGHAGAPSNVNFIDDHWLYTGGTLASQGADILVSGTATNKSNNIVFTNNSCPGLSVGATCIKFDFTQDDKVSDGIYSGHTASSFNATANAARINIKDAISSDVARLAGTLAAFQDCYNDISGRTACTGTEKMGDGSLTHPSFEVGTTGNGLYHYTASGADAVSIANVGVDAMRLDVSLLAVVLPATWELVWGSSGVTTPDIGLGRTAAKTLTVCAVNGSCPASNLSILQGSQINKDGQADIVADSAAINTTDTVIVKTPALAASRLVAGSHIRITLTGTCTSTVGNTSTFTLRWGTNGTTADGSVAALVTNAAATSGTNNGFRTVIDLTVRTAGASATSDAFMETVSDGNIGISATPSEKFIAGTAFNTTTASAILSLSYKSAATTTTSTFKNAYIEIVQN